MISTQITNNEHFTTDFRSIPYLLIIYPPAPRVPRAKQHLLTVTAELRTRTGTEQHDIRIFYDIYSYDRK